MRSCGLVTHGCSGAGDVFSQCVLDRATIACVRDRMNELKPLAQRYGHFEDTGTQAKVQAYKTER